MTEARANLATVLQRAREGQRQTIRQGGLADVAVDADVPEAPMTYLLDALPGRDGREIALEQFRQRAEGADDEVLASELIHVPDNLSGDVVQWISQVRGRHQTAIYVVVATEDLRDAQEVLGLPLSTVSQVMAGLSLAASGGPDLFDAQTRELIAALARKKWRSRAWSVLGADW